MRRIAALSALAALTAAAPVGPPRGTVAAAYDLLDRVLPGSRSHFLLNFVDACAGTPAASCYTIADAPGGRVAVNATSASELTAALGVYFTELCNFTIGWPRAGGSRVFLPPAWPAVGAVPITRARNSPWSYVENVCTHSYSLVWYNWTEWQAFIDWQALSGINMVLSMTGQEYVQWCVGGARREALCAAACLSCALLRAACM